MMDPGWLSGSRTQRGPEDEGTYDGGNDPVGVIRRCVWLMSICLNCNRSAMACELTRSGCLTDFSKRLTKVWTTRHVNSLTVC